jgi:hypothetical protein
LSLKVCIGANTLGYPQGGGHRWVYLNWALGLRALGCDVIWLEAVRPDASTDEVCAQVDVLRSHLEPYGLADRVALFRDSEPLPWQGTPLDLDAAAEADLLLNFRYGTSPVVVGRFRRSVLVDIDPGLLQVWMSTGQISVARHDLYFSTGETVGRPGARFPDAGLPWQYTPPCVALDWWPPYRAARDAPFTTVSHWYMDEWIKGEDGEFYRNDKQSGFLPFLDLPSRTTQPLELALCLGYDGERVELEERGWRVRHSQEVTSTPWDYQRFVQASRGEFSCVKPSCVRLQNAWISDRTLCYLASGKPAVIEHTGPSRLLPNAAGLFRFRTMDEAVRCLETVVADYERQCGLARALVEEHFDAGKVVARVLERAAA